MQCVPLPKNAFCPRLFLSLGCASARKLRLGLKHALFGPDTQLTIKGDKALIFFFATGDLHKLRSFYKVSSFPRRRTSILCKGINLGVV
jgi:hypothetical protein